MSVTIEPLVNEPALVVRDTICVLVVADIHLGIEWDLLNRGIVIPNQSRKALEKMQEYMDSVHPERVVLLGDVKHNIPQISWQERVEVPHFLGTIARQAPVDIIPGNHDGDIQYLLQRIPPELKVTLQPVKGCVLDGVGYFHGHTWPDSELVRCDHIIMAHNHPMIRFIDSLGASSAEPAWIRTRMKRQPLDNHYRSAGMNGSDPEVIIMPAFCRLCGGVAFNESPYDDLLGPVFASDLIDLENAQAYLADGTRLGKLKDLKKLDITQKRQASTGKVTARGKVSRSP